MDWYADGSDPEQVSALRSEIAAFLRRHAAEPDDAAGAELVVGELVANVVRHAPGPLWASIHWSAEAPVLTVHDLGAGFSLPQTEPDPLAEHGRGLAIVGALVEDLQVRVRETGGAKVTAVLPVRRAPAVSIDPPRRRTGVLPLLDEADATGAFGKEPFLRALVVQLAQSVEEGHGPDAAEAAVAQVGTDVGGQMEAAYRATRQLSGRLSPEEVADCLVNLKAAIHGGFRVVEVTPDRIVLDNTRCPFGDVVRRAPQLCRMTSSVFGGIAARNAERGADVVLEERIAVGDAGCRVVIHLDADEPVVGGHHYAAPT